MKYLPLVWAGIWRKRGRSLLIFLQVAVAFTLFGVLQGVKTGAEHAVAAARADLLIVHSRLGFAVPLTLAMLEQIRSVPGVKEAIPVALVFGTYQNPSQQVALVGIRPDQGWLSAFTYTTSAAYAKALRATRTGALVNLALAQKYGWKIGDRIPVMTGVAQRGGSTVWTVDVVGTFTDSDIATQTRNSVLEGASVVVEKPITPDEIVGRALSMSTCSPEKLGPRRDAFEADLRAALSAEGGFTEIATLAALIARRP